jgi:hypothetical protein
MKNAVWLVIGLVIAGASWVPLNLSDPRDIPFIPAIMGIVGSVLGGVIALVNLVRWVRHSSATR